MEKKKRRVDVLRGKHMKKTFKHIKIYQVFILIFMFLQSSCGKTDVKDNILTTEIQSSSEADILQEESTEELKEEITEDIVEDDFTKHGIWKHEIEPHVYEYFVMLDDGSGYLIWEKNISEIKWSYSITLNTITVTFKEWNTIENYEIEENNSVVLMKAENYTFIFMGNDKDEEQKMIVDAQEVSENGEEKVEGATIINKNGMTRKVYDTPLKMVDDEYITLEITAIFINENTYENGVYAGYEYNVINKTDRYAWITIYNYYINNTQVEINYSDIDHCFNNPLRGESKAINKNEYGLFDSMTLDDLETLSFSLQLNINDTPDQYGSNDQVYSKAFDFPKDE